MDITVAIGTGRESNARKKLDFFAILVDDLMAFCAIHSLVFAQQRILGFFMIKAQHRFPGIIIMARKAIGG
jgi:hypothetical protein